MNPEIKKKWLEALKSGRYKRVKGQLKHREGETVKHCCLGVLCELHHEMTGEGNWDNNSMEGYFSKTNSIDNSALVLPAIVRDWAGLDSQNALFVLDDDELREKARKMSNDYILTEASLTEINDLSEEKDFSDVIPFIEKLF